MQNNFLITWNIFLTISVVLLLLNMKSNDASSYDTAQDTVICGYITDLQIQSGIDRSGMPNCQGDIDSIFRIIK